MKNIHRKKDQINQNIVTKLKNLGIALVPLMNDTTADKINLNIDMTSPTKGNFHVQVQVIREKSI